MDRRRVSYADRTVQKGLSDTYTIVMKIKPSKSFNVVSTSMSCFCKKDLVYSQKVGHGIVRT